MFSFWGNTKKTHNTTVPVVVLRVDVDRVDLEQPPDDVDVAVGRGAMEGGVPGAQAGRVQYQTRGMHAQTRQTCGCMHVHMHMRPHADDACR